MRALQIAATGMSAQQMRVEVLSNNLANMSTASDGTLVPTGVQSGSGVRPAAVTINLAQGSSSNTGGDLDLAIEGPGYIEVQLPSGA
ncbi:hypothetical protein OY671_012372, partial [Metschnikowia pulcherrima]